MSCCHTEIRECGEDLDKLRIANSRLLSIRQLNIDIQGQLGIIAGLCEEAFMASGMAEIKNAVNATVKPFIETITENGKRISNDTRKIERDRYDYIDEDDYYHSQEDDDDDD